MHSNLEYNKTSIEYIMSKKIICKFCDGKFGSKQIINHRRECLSNFYKDKKGYLISMYSYGISGQIYELYIIVNKGCKLHDIDMLLKKIWCECCGHLSMFELCVDGDNGYEEKEISKKTKLTNYEIGAKIMYTYDMGTTTTVFIEIIKELKGKINSDNIIELVYRNDKPLIKCKKCRKKAKFLKEGIPFCHSCSKCSDSESNDSDNYDLAKIVNSPRAGVCGYS